MIVDTSTGNTVAKLENIPVRVSGFSSSMPSLECAWLNENKIRFSTSELTDEMDPEFYFEDDPFLFVEGYFHWADFAIENQTVETHPRYSGLGLSHETPIPGHLKIEKPKRWTEGLLERNWHTIFRPGTDEVIATIASEDGIVVSSMLEVSPDGRWAAFNNAKDEGRLYLVDGATLEVRKISEEWAPDIGWNRCTFLGW